ncbi:hypothetical protein IB67_05920 [Fervidobacterium riparium]|nr:hypothetical protein IB67_05920 [Fervidobacterium riparium]
MVQRGQNRLGKLSESVINIENCTSFQQIWLKGQNSLFCFSSKCNILLFSKGTSLMKSLLFSFSYPSKLIFGGIVDEDF